MKISLFRILLISFFTISYDIKPANTNYRKTWQETNIFDKMLTLDSISKERLSYHESGHLVVAKLLGLIVEKVLINPKESSGIIKITYSSKEIDQYIKTALASYITEQIFFGKVNKYTSKDIDVATKNIISLYKISLEDNDSIKNILQNYIDQTQIIILQNMDLITKFSQLILKRQELNKTEIDEAFKALLT